MHWNNVQCTKFSVNIRGPKEEQSILDARSRSSKESEWATSIVGYLTLTREGKADLLDILAMSNGNSRWSFVRL